MSAPLSGTHWSSTIHTIMGALRAGSGLNPRLRLIMATQLAAWFISFISCVTVDNSVISLERGFLSVRIELDCWLQTILENGRMKEERIEQQTWLRFSCSHKEDLFYVLSSWIMREFQIKYKFGNLWAIRSLSFFLYWAILWYSFRVSFWSVDYTSSTENNALWWWDYTRS